MSARERLGFYASRFPLAEVATTYRFPPTPALAAQWVERTPAGFVFDIRAWSLLSGAPTLPDSLWTDLHGEVHPAHRDRRRLYPAHLSADGLSECWRRFAHALTPLVEAGRLGAVILQYPSWFSPRPDTWGELAALVAHLPGIQVAVELRNAKWVVGDACETTLGFLEDHGIAFVCTDGPATGERALPPVVAATAPVAIARFCGRRSVEGEPWTWPYRYSGEELDEWVPRVAQLASGTEAVHLIADNCWRTDAVDAAAGLLRRCRPGHAPPAAVATE